jgi:hypothetical protein
MTCPEGMGVSGEVARVSATVHGYSVAMAWGAAILLAATVPIAALLAATLPMAAAAPIAALVNAGAPARRPLSTGIRSLYLT